MSNSVNLSFEGDSKSLDDAAKKVDKSLDGISQHSDKVAHGIDSVGEHMEKSVGKFRGGKDALDGLSGAFETVGVTIPGPVGGILGMAGSLADLADGLATTVLPALKGLWAVMAANPLIAIIAGVALLAAGFVLAYKKSQTFRDIVWAILDGLKTEIKFVADVFSKVADALFQPFKFAFNAIAKAWNSTVGGFGFSIPSWVPFVGGDSFAIPNIPTFANGGRTLAGPMMVGERGPEIFTPNVPGMVTPMRGGGGGPAQAVQVTVSFAGMSNDDLVAALRRGVRIQGGNVQQVLGANH